MYYINLEMPTGRLDKEQVIDRLRQINSYLPDNQMFYLEEIDAGKWALYIHRTECRHYTLGSRPTETSDDFVIVYEVPLRVALVAAESFVKGMRHKARQIKGALGDAT